MKKTIYLLLLIIPLLMNSQSLKKVKNKLPENSIEVFYVLKSDNLIKQGSYELLKNNNLIVSGNYINNVKNGKWTLYHLNTTKSAEGDYNNGKRVGIWKFYNNKDQLIQTYDFEKEILTNEGPLKKGTIPKVGNGKYSGLLFTDKEPEFKNGKDELLNFIKSNYKYSELTKQTSSKGVIYVGAILDEKSNLSEIKVLKGIDEILDTEALRVTNLMKGKWNSAEFEGEKIAKKIVIPYRIN